MSGPVRHRSSSLAVRQATPDRPPPDEPPPILNHGGPIIATPNIYLIWYGNWNQANGSDTPAGQQIVRDWAGAIGGSPHFSINASYPGVTGSVLVPAAQSETRDAYSNGKRLSDAKVKNVVTGATSGNLLPYDPDGVYFVLTSSDVSESSGFCTRYCGWHTAASSSVGRIRYSFDPDLNAWYDSSGAENADKCAWTFGHSSYQVANGAWANMKLGTRDYLIQRNLDHALSGGGDYCMVDPSKN